ncbi:MAG TPA: hypothetical protein VN641_13065 [Urbifossiella sp.]|nr:hypothetical protein [Urbifossiella sp.]
MSMTPSTERAYVQRWREFWFAPGDPTTLGFIRIVTGLLVLYTHLAYSVDLQEFFGKYGWYGTQYIDRERHEYPRSYSSFWDWDESKEARASTPDFPHRRAAVIQFIRDLPKGRTERERAVHYLWRVGQESNAYASYQELSLVLRLKAESATDADREAILMGLTQKKQWYAFRQGGPLQFADKKPATGNSELMFPELMLAAPIDTRLALADDLRALVKVLPADPTEAKYVVNHLMELDQGHRQAFVEFLINLPDDAPERTAMIDYLDRWNNDPSKLDRRGHPIVSVWFHVTNPREMAIVHAAVLVIIALFTIGFCTRVTSVLTWIAVVGYIHRTNQVLFGMDTMMNILLIYLMIGNSGAALSVDRLIARYRAVRASLRRSGTIDEPTRAFLAGAPLSSGANFGVRLIQVHFCFIYLASGCSKLLGQAWWNGTAIWDVMINPEFTLLRYPWFENAMRWMVGNELFGKPLYFISITLGVWFTWGLEISFPFLVWTRLRSVMLWLAVLLHAGIGVLMGLNLFELLMMTMLLVYIPPGVIRDRFRGTPSATKLLYRFASADGKQSRAAAIVAAFDIDDQVKVEAAKSASQPTSGELFGSLRLLRPLRFLLYIPGISGMASRCISPANEVKSGVPKSGPPAPAAAS